MCGIFAYKGDRDNAAHIVLTGLKILEYRGYDSWGIAIKPKTENGKRKTGLILDKHVGEISKAVISNQLSVISSLAIGHTRWATHGGVTRQNAHPHLDCAQKISVVHNGIVENSELLKKQLIKRGHKFLSTTDSEVIPHMIEDELKTKDFSDAVQAAFKKLTGLNAIVVASINSNELIAIKTGSPLVIGKEENGYYVASDASSIVPVTQNLLFLSDYQVARINKKLTITDLYTGSKIKPEFEKVSWSESSSSKGDFSHFMIKEIHEQPRIIRNIAKTFRDQVTSLAKIIEKARGTFFIGAGTASYAALSGTYFFSKLAGHHINMSSASEFMYQLDFINKNSLVVALSQSGETIDIVEPLTKVKEKEATIATLVNTQGSTIFRMSDKKILLEAGIEHAVASTKAYTAKLAILHQLAFAIKKELDSSTNQLLASASEIERILKNADKLDPIARILSKKDHIYIIGRGVSFPSALEAALKIKEVSYIHAEGLAGGELKHGALALITKGTPCIVFAPNDETNQSIISNATEIKSRGGVIIGISHKKETVFDFWIEVRDCQDAAAITQIVPVQLLAYKLALIKGFDPDKPRNLAKSVTVK